MTAGRTRANPAALTAARHLEEFGFTGWHLIRSETYDPATDTLASPENRRERQVAEALGYPVEGSAARHDGAVFLMAGEPRPKVGDGLVALTRHWLIERIDVMDPGGHEIYALICV